MAAFGSHPLEEEGAHLAVIEAGTGTGKTLGYLLPALALAHLRGKHLVVASSTVALQEQLLHKDVPALRQCLPFEVRCAVAKERARYVCPVRLEAGGTAGTALPDHPDAAAQDGVPTASASSIRLIGRLADAFAKDAWPGDRDSWPNAIPDADWRAVSTDRQGCLGGKCPQFKRCPFYLARQEMKEANLMKAYADSVGGRSRKVAAAPQRDEVDLVLEGITDPVVRTRVNLLLAELRSLRAQLLGVWHLANQNAVVIIDGGSPPAGEDRGRDPERGRLHLSVLERRALEAAISERTLAHWGWNKDLTGRILSDSGQVVFGAGFIGAIEKVLGELI